MAEENARRGRKWIIIGVSAACVVVVVVVLALVNSGKLEKDKQRAIDIVKEYLDESDSITAPGQFETWVATGDRSMMEVCATYYPREEEGHSTEVLHEMRWKVNLNTGSVVYIESLEHDG